MNRKIFLSLLSTTPLIGVLPKNKKQLTPTIGISKIQYYKDYIFVMFDNGIISQFRDTYTFDEFRLIAEPCFDMTKCCQVVDNDGRHLFTKNVHDISYIV